MTPGPDGKIEVPAPKGPLSAERLLDLLVQTAFTFEASGHAPWAEVEATLNGRNVLVRVTLREKVS